MSPASLPELRRQMRAIAPPACRGRLTLDGGAVDVALGGGLALGALHSVEGAGIEAETGAGPAWFIAGLLRRLRSEAPVFWLAQVTDLYAPGLAALGLDPARLIQIRTAAEDETLAVAEMLLRSGAASAVVAEIGRMGELAGRRLHMACLARGATLLVLRRFPHGRKPAPEIMAAVTRWRVSPVPGLASGRMPGPARLRCALLHARGAPPGEWVLEQEERDDATHAFRVVAGLADPSAASRRLAG